MQYVRFVGYNKNSKIPTLSLNAQTNKYHCSRCNASGFSIGLYSKLKGIDTKKAYRELLERECFSQDKSNIEISPINLLANIETRDKIYREFLGMLKLEKQHKQYLSSIGLLESTMADNLYRTIPSNYVKRRLICHSLARNIIFVEYLVSIRRRILNGVLMVVKGSLCLFLIIMGIFKDCLYI